MPDERLFLNAERMRGRPFSDFVKTRYSVGPQYADREDTRYSLPPRQSQEMFRQRNPPPYNRDYRGVGPEVPYRANADPWAGENDRPGYRREREPKTNTRLIEAIKKWKYVVPEADRERVLREAHEDVQAAHLGIDKTYNRLLIQYFWPGMYVDTIKFVHQCTPCEDLKVTQRQPVGLLGERIVEKPWTVVAADIMGPLPRSRSGFSFLLVIQDLFTKWVEIAPLRSATGPKIREKLDELVVTRWGTPRVFHSDNGTEFRNKAIAEYARDPPLV